MKIGVNTWVWVAPLTTNELEWLVPHIKSLGFDWIELALEDIGAVDYDRACRLIADHDMGVSVCAAMGDDRDLIHPDPAIRANGAAYIRECVNAAYALGAHVVGGPLYSAVGRVWKQTPDEREHDMHILVGQLRQLSQYAADHDVKLGVEALNRFETSFVNLTDQAIEIVDRVDHPACKVMVDTFHANIEESKLGDALRRAGDRLVHVHTCENDRGTPGSGHLPWEDVAAALKDIDYQGACVIESFTNKVETIAKAAAIWRPLATSQDDLARNGLHFLRALLA
jgi:D-psicose/D-tagatose/L-ribulose 3-epimerase